MLDDSGYRDFPVLETERLVLRELRASDAPDIFVFSADPDVQKYNGRPMRDIAEVMTAIEQDLEDARAWRRLMWAITLRHRNIAIGRVGLANWAKEHHRAEIGYDLARAYWRRGLGTEAVRAVVHYGFDRLQLHRIEAFPTADNRASIRLLEKLGFVREGTAREVLLMDDGTYHDVAQYSLLSHEYRA